MQWWGGIARYDQGGTCELCERGEAVYCAAHFLTKVKKRRAQMRELGVSIGEPSTTYRAGGSHD